MSAVQPWVRHECDGKPMSRWWDLGRTAGSVAAWAGVATGAAAVGFATERYVMGRSWRGEDPYADEALGSLRGTSRTVVTDDGVSLYVEVDEPTTNQASSGRLPDDDVTVVPSHRYAPTPRSRPFP